MIARRGSTGFYGWTLWVILLSVILAASALDWGAGRWQAANADQWTKVTLLYSSDTKGKIDPCG
jgi:hypothetical protein